MHCDERDRYQFLLFADIEKAFKWLAVDPFIEWWLFFFLGVEKRNKRLESISVLPASFLRRRVGNHDRSWWWWWAAPLRAAILRRWTDAGSATETGGPFRPGPCLRKKHTTAHTASYHWALEPPHPERRTNGQTDRQAQLELLRTITGDNVVQTRHTTSNFPVPFSIDFVFWKINIKW